MGVFRFANPASDILKLVKTYKTLYNELKDNDTFTHDTARDAMIKNSLVSSSGAIGKEAIKRSLNKNRSLDPLYNQLKMYSEIYRMLGWYKPASKRGHFNFTDIGEYIYEANDSLSIKLFEFFATRIVSPNHLVKIKGGNILRPFPLILKLMKKCNGYITRDEIILTVLNCQNDLNDNVLINKSKEINDFRTDIKLKNKSMKKLISTSGISETTLGNYTRFVLASLKNLEWAEPIFTKSLYKNKNVKAYKITKYGEKYLKEIETKKDVRNIDISSSDLSTRGKFTLLMFYRNLEDIGYNVKEVTNIIETLENDCKSLLSQLDVISSKDLLYSSLQEAKIEEIEFAHKYNS